MAALSVELEKIVKSSVPEKIFYDCVTIQDMADYLVALPAKLLDEKAKRDLHQFKESSLKSKRKIAIPDLKERSRKIN
jgi:hypothetical protein